MTDPDPLTPPDCDLQSFQYMELDVQRLRDSKFASCDPEAFRAGVLLWCAAWHQVPAASLPDDDTELAKLAGYGNIPRLSVKAWRKVRDQALHGFVKCNDGRLYHATIAEKAVAAMLSKEKHAYDKFLERMRKENKARATDGKQPFGIPTREQWKSGAYPHGIPPEEQTKTSQSPPEDIAISGGNRSEQNRTERNGTETTSVPSGTGGAAAKPADQLTRDELWAAGKSLLISAGMPKPQCGSFVGKLVKDYGDQIVVDAVRAAVVARPADPAEYLKATCMRAAGQRAKPSNHAGFSAKNYREGITQDGHLT